MGQAASAEVQVAQGGELDVTSSDATRAPPPDPVSEPPQPSRLVRAFAALEARLVRTNTADPDQTNAMARSAKSAEKTNTTGAPVQKKKKPATATTPGKVKKPAKASIKPVKSILKNGKKSVKFAKSVASVAGEKKVKRKRKSSKKTGNSQRFKFEMAPLRSDLLPEERVAGATTPSSEEGDE